MKESRALIVALVLLLLPVLYVGSYLALVVPYKNAGGAYGFGYPLVEGTRAHVILSKFYYPLERIDLAIRPDSWRWEQTY
jgi:hypothetical protein